MARSVNPKRRESILAPMPGVGSHSHRLQGCRYCSGEGIPGMELPNTLDERIRLSINNMFDTLLPQIGEEIDDMQQWLYEVIDQPLKTTDTPEWDSIIINEIQTTSGTIQIETAAATGTTTYTSEADASVFEGDTSKNHQGFMQAQIEKYGSNWEYWGWTRFNLAGLPAGATLTKATMRLWQIASGSTQSTIRVARSADVTWNENTISWNTMPAVTALTTDLLIVGKTAAWRDWDVTKHVQKSIADGQGTVTFVLTQLLPVDNARVFLGRGYAGYEPKFILEYTTGSTEVDIDVSGDVWANAVHLRDSNGLFIQDPSESYYTNIALGSTLTSSVTLNILTGDADRTITLLGDPTLADWFNQGVKTTDSPSFAGMNVTGDMTVVTLDVTSQASIAYLISNLATITTLAVDELDAGDITALSLVVTGIASIDTIIADSIFASVVTIATLDVTSFASLATVKVGGGGTFGGIVGATDFAKTGWPLTPGVTISFDNANRRLTVTDGGTAHYYIDGVKYTLGGNKTVDITDTEGLWYIYFVGATLTASQTIWDIADEDKALVAYLYWDATNNKETFLGYELHSFHMSGATHARLHYAGGARWESGLLVADAGAEDVNVSAGDIWDEDINISITDGAGAALFEQVLSPAELPIYYRSGATAWRVFETGDKANATDAGYVDGANDLKYNQLVGGAYQLTTAGLNNYMAMYVVATNEQTEPVALMMGQRVDNKLSDAKDDNIFSGMDLTGLPFEEMVVLARLILKDTGAGLFYTLEDVQDLRIYNATGNITSPLITDHGGLGGLADDDHVQYILADGSRSFTGDVVMTGDLAVAGSVTMATLEVTSFASIATLDVTNRSSFSGRVDMLGGLFASGISTLTTVSATEIVATDLTVTDVASISTLDAGYITAALVSVTTINADYITADLATITTLTVDELVGGDVWATNLVVTDVASINTISADEINVRDLGPVRFWDDADNNWIGLTAPNTIATDFTLQLPERDGAADDVLKTDGAGKTRFEAGGGGDVTAAANINDNAIVRGDGGAKGVQHASTATIDDNGIMSLTGQSGARAYLGANQSVAFGGYHQITLNNETFDKQGEFNTGTYRFVAGVAGRYLIEASTQIIALDDAESFVVAIYINGGGVSYHKVYSPGANLDPTATALDVFELSANDFVEMYVRHFHAAGNLLFTGGTGSTFMNVTKVA